MNPTPLILALACTVSLLGVEATSSTTGQGQRQDGTTTWNATTRGQAQARWGRFLTWVTERQGTATRNAAGGHDWQATAATTGSQGASSTVQRQGRSDGQGGFASSADRTTILPDGRAITGHSETTGSVTRTAEGRTVHAETTGSSSRGNEWTAVTDKEVTRNGDGTSSVDRTTTITGDQGRTVTHQSEGTVRREGDGQWSWERDGRATGPGGRSAEGHAEGQAARTGRGQWSGSRQGGGRR